MKRSALAMFAVMVLSGMAGTVEGLEPSFAGGVGSGGGQTGGRMQYGDSGHGVCAGFLVDPGSGGLAQGRWRPGDAPGDPGTRLRLTELERRAGALLQLRVGAGGGGEVQLTVTSSEIGTWVGLRQGENVSG